MTPPAGAHEFPALDPERGVMTMAPLLETATPAVVNISVKTRVPQDENPLMRDPFFRRFFDVPEQLPEREAMSAGSGVIVEAAKGYVLTNHRVVDNANEITVTLKDQRRFGAKLIGINTAIIAPGGGNVGIGFAVPSNMVRQVMDQLIRFGEVRRGRVGILIQDLTPDLAAALDLAGRRGAVVSSVQKGSPAEEAGLRSGDVIVEVDGRPIANSSDLRNRIGLMVRGSVVTIGYLRGGKMMTAKVEIGTVREAALKGGEAMPLLAGAFITEIRDDHPAKGRVDGVQVARLAQGSRAWVNGLREGDIILAVNRRHVRSLADFKNAASHDKNLLALNVLRGDSQLFIVMR